ncbi:MAG: carbamoyltransferase C-terminal domain-containing protein [Patescibacteria group bacterium]
MNILGLQLIGHDTGAALIAGLKVVAIAEERLNRFKHSSAFPGLSIDYCLNSLGLKPADIDLIVVSQVGLPGMVDMKKIFLEWPKAQEFRKIRLESIRHYDAHAASTFLCSPFEEAAILIYDGVGQGYINQFGATAYETEALYRGRENKLYEIQTMTHLRRGRDSIYSFGIGKLYQKLSAVYLGFGANNEGKMMGLAAYGDDSLLKRYPLERWVKIFLGQPICNANLFFAKTQSVKAAPNLSAKIQRLLKKVFYLRSWLRWKILSLTRRQNNFKFFEPIKLKRPARTIETLPDPYYSAVAYAAQKILEFVANFLGDRLKAITGSHNLCVAGGCGLNIDANRNFIDRVGFKNLFVQPAASDVGIALGCALYGKHIIFDQPRDWEMKSASLGRNYSETEIKDALSKFAKQISHRKANLPEIAKLLTAGKIIGWFQGGSEYGPRALGHRSILADPRRKEMKDVLNNRVKHREPWRPFAASILLNEAVHWFELDLPSPFMLLHAPARKDKKDLIPAVLHIDNTARLQTVSTVNGCYYELISEFYRLTKVPLLLNTSFNLAGEPIVETPLDAINTFLATEIDFLVVEGNLIEKLPRDDRR